MIYFITGNKNKFAEVKTFLPDIEQLDIHLPEIQNIDAQEIIKAKLQSAFGHSTGEFIVEDTSLSMDCLNGLPGPFIKWFEKSLGNAGLADLAIKLNNNRATAKTIIGYAKSQNEIRFFEGAVQGAIVKPGVATGFGWDPIFLPDGYQQTFAEMGQAGKNKISMRRLAANQLQEFLSKNK